MKRHLTILAACCAGLLGGLATTPNACADLWFFQDFESGLGDDETVFDSSGTGNFGINNTGFMNNGTQMMGHASTYPGNQYAYYEFEVDLRKAETAILTFDFTGEMEITLDGANVAASNSAISVPNDVIDPTNDSEFLYITGDEDNANLGRFFYDASNAAGGSNGTAEFDLTQFVGDRANVRIQFDSDPADNRGGLNVDNVMVEGIAIPEPSSVVALSAMCLAGFGWRMRRRLARLG